MLKKEEKIAIVDNLKKKFEESKFILLSDFTGMTVKEMTDLKRELKKANAQHIVVKNTLASKAMAESIRTHFQEYLKGPIAVTFTSDDPVAPAKIISKFIKENSKPTVKVALVEGRFLNDKEFLSLAKLPTREELIAKAVWGIKAPINNFAFVLSGLLRNLVYVLDAVRQNKK